MAKNRLRYLEFHYWFRKITFSSFFQNLSFLSKTHKRKIVFNSIFKSNHWREYKAPNSGESVSGLGSDLNICKQLIFDLNFFITKNNIKSILDLACGDFMWMKNIVMENENIKSYLGLEIVEGIVKNNNTKYSNNKVKFSLCDVINDEIPENYDLVIMRDFFIHINNNEINHILNKVKKSNPKFFCINTFPHVKKNIDIKAFGHHRDINIELDPFNLNKPFLVLNDVDRKLNIYNLQ